MAKEQKQEGSYVEVDGIRFKITPADSYIAQKEAENSDEIISIQSPTPSEPVISFGGTIPKKYSRLHDIGEASSSINKG